MDFNVGYQFVGWPPFSVEAAQAIVDEAQKCKGRPIKRKRGIGFEPNAVEIEYLRERGRRPGIGLSLYGGPERYDNKLIKLGRTTAYSRALIETRADLESILPLISKAFGFKTGK
jgi:hypothetical protein